MGGNKLMLNKHTYLALGDSYTIGESVEANKTFPYLLAQKKNWKTPTVIAKTGWTVQNLNKELANTTLASKYDFISILIGVNNQYQGLSIVQYEKELEKLIAFSFEKIKDKNNIFILSVPNYGATPFGKNWQSYIGFEIRELNILIEKVAQKHQIQFISITPISEKANKEIALLASDLLHPSTKMYDLWVDKIIDVLI